MEEGSSVLEISKPSSRAHSKGQFCSLLMPPLCILTLSFAAAQAAPTLMLEACKVTESLLPSEQASLLADLTAVVGADHVPVLYRTRVPLPGAT